MSIKILGGMAKGRIINLPKNSSIRPTSVLLRRKFFDSNQNWLDKHFIDLCAGSGAMAIEAWSRGAKSTILVEFNRKNFNALLKTCNEFENSYKERSEGSLTCVNDDCQSYIKKFLDKYNQLSETDKENTYIFLDPPYSKHKIYESVINEILNSAPKFLGHLLIESDEKQGFTLDRCLEMGLTKDKVITHGDSYLLFSKIS